MKYFSIIILLVGALLFNAVTANAWVEWMATENPGESEPPNHPWQTPGQVVVPPGGSLWYAISNYYDPTRTKYFTLKIYGAGIEKFAAEGCSGHYYNHNQISLFSERVNEAESHYYPDSNLLVIHGTLKPQPDWEVVVLTRVDPEGGDVFDFYVEGSSVCHKTVFTARAIRLETRVGGWMDPFDFGEIIIIPPIIPIDTLIPPIIYSPGAQWDYSYTQHDPLGGYYPNGGWHFNTVSGYLPAYEDVNIDFSISGMSDDYYHYWIYDNSRSGWQYYMLTAQSSEIYSHIYMIPDAEPVITQPGGSFGMRGVIGNQTDSMIVTDIWYGVKGFGNFYEQGTFHNIHLPSGFYVSGHLVQQVPYFAPPGDYEYISYSGDYSTRTVNDSFSFNFTIAPPVKMGGYDSWTAKGSFVGDYDDSSKPQNHMIVSNYPNPFNAATTITYELETDSDVRLEIYNLMGQRITTLVDSHNKAGRYSLSWDASGYSSGTYFFKLTADNNSVIKRMMLLK
ncbi:MAG: T9SS type A sorting domain-containing protein [candidate division Zixibacteria bacterium]|nr:T9SS type A sorting domain-containing protein [candidate division Zixibacteria bacterium]